MDSPEKEQLAEPSPAVHWLDGQGESLREEPGPRELPKARGESRGDLGACLFVWGTYAVMLIAAVIFVQRFGNQLPYVDDWANIQGLTAGAPSPSWLWNQHNEHRYPMARLLSWVVWKATGGEFRAIMLCGVLAMGVSAFLLILTARALRGRMSYADAFFPFALLHWGQAENLLWVVQLYVFFSTSLYCIILALLLNESWLTRPGRALILPGCALLLPLQGGGGVAYVPALALLFACIAVFLYRRGYAGARWKAFGLVALATALCVLLVLYFSDYARVERHGAGKAGLVEKLKTSAEFLGMGLGTLGVQAWPASGVGVTLLVLASFALLLRAWLRRPADRLRLLSLFFTLGAAASLAAGMGWGRGALGGLATRYITLSVPTLCCVYFVWEVCSRPAVAQFVQMCLFAVACAMSSYHLSLGLDYGKYRHRAMQAFEADVAAHIPVTGLVGRHAAYWCWDEKPMHEGLEMLRAAGVRPFAGVRPDPPMCEIPLPLVPTRTEGVRWDGHSLSVLEKQGLLEFPLPKPQQVYAIRFRFGIRANEPHVSFSLSGQKGGATVVQRQPAPDYPIKVLTGPPIRTRTFWLDEEISSFQMMLSGPCDLEIHEAVLLCDP
jgi:hypothetical protein